MQRWCHSYSIGGQVSCILSIKLSLGRGGGGGVHYCISYMYIVISCPKYCTWGGWTIFCFLQMLKSWPSHSYQASTLCCSSFISGQLSLSCVMLPSHVNYAINAKKTSASVYHHWQPFPWQLQASSFFWDGPSLWNSPPHPLPPPKKTNKQIKRKKYTIPKVRFLLMFVFYFNRYTVKREKGSIGMSVIMDPMANKWIQDLVFS